MTPVVPRWEWREFGDQAAGAYDRLEALPSDAAEESAERYIVSRRSRASVKIRGGQLDVKELVEVDETGLQRWRPVLKGDFPLRPDDLAIVSGALGGGLKPAVGNCTLEQLLAAVDEDAEMLAVGVHKRRRHYVVDGCMAEASEIATGACRAKTVAVESEDPALVRATLQRLGLAGKRNLDLPAWLRATAGVEGPRFAAIDVGTNSVKFQVAERAADGRWPPVVDRSEMTRLGEGLDEAGRLGDEPVERTVEAITGMAEEARALGVQGIAAVGTAGLRRAPNRDELIDAVRARTGVEVEVISGEEEARISYLGVLAGIGAVSGSLAVFETGGGSSQFTFGSGDHIDERFSVDVGAVALTERFGLAGRVDQERVGEVLAAVGEALRRLDGRQEPDLLVGLGGAVTNMTAVMHELAEYDPDVVQGSVLRAGEVDRQIELYRSRGADERRRIVGLQPKRAEVILAGACVARAVLSMLGCDSMTVSDRGLRHGLLAERF
ncbi:MAG TPA: Ppx/GppA phosphatase family protein [Gaiellales bacterium]|jgi:exopolyphosphatase/guanosine-5'-triphosphate,3'-diphosphate pyrophosphatase|nr:Ppx/GppA phosphatase family protein [Gaiellales bacterium]